MKISPIELRQMEFTRRLWGFDPKEVGDLLDTVRDELEQMIRDSNQLKDELKKALNQVAERREKDGLLRETLLSAQKVNNEIREQAKREAEIIVADAEMRARAIVADAQSRAGKLYEDLTSLRQQKVQVREEIRSLLETARKWLDIDERAEEEDTTIEQRLRFMPPLSAKAAGG